MSRPPFFLVFFLLVIVFSIIPQEGEGNKPEVLYYKSNGLGMPLERVDEDRDEKYILTVSSIEDVEISKLYIDGRLETQWERQYLYERVIFEKEITGSEIIERTFSRGRLVTERRIVEEIEEDRWEYSYVDNSLSESIFFIKDSEEFRDRYVKDRDGKLLRVDREYLSGEDVITAYSYPSDSRYSEWFEYGKLSELFTYNQGVLSTHEVWDEGELYQRIS